MLGFNKKKKELQNQSKTDSFDNDPMSLFMQGMACEMEIGNRHSTAKAIQYYTKAAELGHDVAQYVLGTIYATGKMPISEEHVPKSIPDAVKWYKKAADQNNADAQHELAGLYWTGNGVPKSEKEAARLCTLAAKQGHMLSQFMLGIMYHSGKGVEQSNSESIKWFRLAAEQGHEESIAIVKEFDKYIDDLKYL